MASSILACQNSRSARLVTNVAAQRAPGDPGASLPRPSPLAAVVGVQRSRSMATDAEIDAAVAAMRAVRTIGGKIHDDVLRAYARAALEASARVQIEAFR